MNKTRRYATASVPFAVPGPAFEKAEALTHFTPRFVSAEAPGPIHKSLSAWCRGCPGGGNALQALALAATGDCFLEPAR